MSKFTFKLKSSKKPKDDDRFHIVIAPAISIAQFFGLLPIVGISSKNIKDIKFKLYSIRTLHTSFWFLSGFIFLYLETVRLVNVEHFNAQSVGGIAFFATGIISSLLYLRIAYKWSELLQMYKEVDDIFCSELYTLSGWSLKKQIKFASITLLLFAFLEHVCFWYSFLFDIYMQAEVCNWQIESWFYHIFRLHLKNIFDVFPVNIVFIMWAVYMNVSFTFAWNYVDLFIIIMSLSIASKFRMINERLNGFKGRILTDTYWEEIRRHYSKICELNDYIGDNIGSLICVACLGDLYSICMQLLKVTNPLLYPASKIYFWLSTLFLIARTLSMFLITASVNEEALKPLLVFRAIPGDGWFPQVRRFCNQIQHNSAALSGRKFFFLNRSTIISITGTVITYELVLLQFDRNGGPQEVFDPCGGIYNQTISY
ncbi:gustatory receptor for sugar taste 64f-like [Chironomus tepperi]|uniref:gustatory receptor for sugar taste 64f-like n=1 Tax=Chironomus tepperi TaxID=113505 RepID=UPI00391F319F